MRIRQVFGKRKVAIGALIVATSFISVKSVAAPSTLEPIIGGALQCFDKIDPVAFRKYLIANFKESKKGEGGADWFKSEGARIFGLEVEEIFVSDGTGRTDFIGAIFKARLDEASRTIQQNRGVKFMPESSSKQLRSPAGSYLIEYDKTKSKMFCVKYRP